LMPLKHSHRIPVSLANPMPVGFEHLTTARRLMHRAGNDNSEGNPSALRTMRGWAGG